VTKEEAFRVCGIPYAFLGDVLEFLSGKPEVSLSGMTKEEFERYEKMSREILVNAMEKRDLAAHGLRLCDISVNFPELKIASAKKVLSYVQAVEEHEFSTKVSDPRTEELLRQALDLPNDQKNVLGLIRNLGIGAYWARQLVTILLTFQGGGFQTPSISIKSIVSESYGKYSPYDERSRRERAPPPAETEFVQERREERRESHRMEEREEHGFDEVRDAPLKRSREVEAFGEAPAERRQRNETRPSRGREQPPAPKEVPSDLVGRRCLFHGGIAVARCHKCKAVLCKECIRGSERCPRCNTPLGSAEAPEEPPRERRKPRRDQPEEPSEGTETEDEPDEQDERPRKRGRDTQKARKKEDGEELSRL